MMCERCGIRPATVHKVRIENGVKTELHLCEECARETGELHFGPSPFGATFEDLMKSFFDLPFMEAPSAEAPARAPTRCPNCGLTWSDFKRLGQLGCSQCYDTFQRELGPVLRRLHGATEHAGKRPGQHGESVRRRQLERLREELREAIASEQYERAATLRDQIRQIEKESKQP
ncbi:MAG: UvrB/UvrC motif-containing protein [Limnochordaceae bacterium]|uniref:UvrB/UvrC motif-containing protein n=1 Tax=Carboxydichorda subterranea TaxID=3109565 RepID=A0ABZ1BY14_9FIRM|nr:UvrB/UvrC motif-containing protein [Limnochorda sp. L945t]MBE3599071.1 UvrB/UvrC motif-containing protein [Limnochordaceae bacterium]WRP17682.1 UvrB/UvrC motif-containing protein [Limnochorda sp. L945t]